VLQGFYCVLGNGLPFGQTHLIGRQRDSCEELVWRRSLRVIGNFIWYLKIVDAVTSGTAWRIEKARNELGYSSRCALEDGLRETIRQYGQNGMVLCANHMRVLLLVNGY
jgi:hypothetical protein